MYMNDSTLANTYRSWRHELAREDWTKANLTAPLLVEPTERYLSATRRVLILGQETRQWGWEATELHAIRAACPAAPPNDTWNLVDFIANEDGVDAMLAAYRGFAFAKHNGAVRRSAFWKALHRFNAPDGQAILWSNLCRCAFNADGGGHSLFRLEVSLRDRFIAAQSELAIQEVRLLHPDICLLFSGPVYDPILVATFPNCSLEPVEGFERRVLARVVHPDLPVASFRTYHPNYLARSRQTNVVLDKLDELIACS